jgi:hypothetical protein
VVIDSQTSVGKYGRVGVSNRVIVLNGVDQNPGSIFGSDRVIECCSSVGVRLGVLLE